MRTFTNSITKILELTQNNTSANQTFCTDIFNQSIRTVASIRNGKWKWLETVEEMRTMGGRGTYQIPNNIRKVVDIYTRVGGSDDSNMLYMPIMVYDPYRWKAVLSSLLGSSDVPRFMYIHDDVFEVNPIPQTDNNIMYIRGRKDLRDLSIADYTTGSIVTVPYLLTMTGALAVGAVSGTLSSNWTLPTGTYEVTFSSDETRPVTLTNGANTMTWTDALEEATTTAMEVGSDTGGSIIIGTGTTWTVPMAGRWLQITDSSSANKGDGFWYQVDEVYSTTALALKKQYQGTPIVAGTAAYTLGQVSVIPEAYQDAPIYRTVATYWSLHGNMDRANLYWRMYDGGVEAGLSKNYGGLIGQMLDESGATEEGSYISPNGWEPWRFDPNNPNPPVGQASF